MSRLIIANPVAGRGRARAVVEQVRRESGNEVPVHWTTGPGDALRRALAFVRSPDPRGIVAVGGDGTVHEVVNGMWQGGTLVPLRVLPAGTGNDFARNAAAAAGRPLDLGRLEFTDPEGAARDVVFLNSASVGVSPRANRLAQRIGRLIRGRLRYPLGGIAALCARAPRAFTLEEPGRTLRVMPLNLTFANGPSFGGGMRIAPAASLTDGALDRVLIGSMGTLRALLALSRLRRGGHVAMPEVEVTRSPEPVTLWSPGPPIPLEADGQDFEAAGPVRVSLLPGVLGIDR